MKKWFLYKVYKLNKGLFVFFILLSAGTAFTNLSGWQATPFFVWGMYSEKEDTSQMHPILKITINNSLVLDHTDYTESNKVFLISPLQFYVAMKKNNGEDPTGIFLKRKLGANYSSIQNVAQKVLNDKNEYNSFLPWYKRYLEQTTGIQIHSYKVELLEAAYSKDKIEIHSTELIDKWQQ